MEDAAAPAHIGDMTTTENTKALAEGDIVFITTKNAQGDERILFASAIDYVLETAEGDLIVVDGLRFRQLNGLYRSQSGSRTLFLHGRSAELIAELKDRGVALRKAKQATVAEQAARRNRISQASDSVGRARSRLSSITGSLRWRRAERDRAQVQLTVTQRKVDAYESDVVEAETALETAQAKLAAAEEEAG